MDGDVGHEAVPTIPTAGAIRYLAVAIVALVHSGVFVSLATASVALTAVVLLGLPLEPFPLMVVFAATLLVYALDRVLDRDDDVLSIPGRVDFMDRYGRVMLLLSVVLYGGLVIGAFAMAVPGAPFLFAPPIIIGLYSIGGLKRLFLAKNLLVGGCWGAIPVGVAVYYGQPLSTEVLALAGFFTVMVTIAAAIFDIKDIAADSATGVTTLPTEWGVRRTRQVALVGTLAGAGGLVGAVFIGALDLRFLSLLVLSAYVTAYLPFGTPDRGPLFYGFVVDGEHVALAIVVLVLEGGVW